MKKLLTSIIAAIIVTSCGKNIDNKTVHNNKENYEICERIGHYTTRHVLDLQKDGNLDTAYTIISTEKGGITWPSELTENDHRMYDTLYPKIKEAYK